MRDSFFCGCFKIFWLRVAVFVHLLNVLVAGRERSAVMMTPVKLKITREDSVQSSISGNVGYCGDFLTPQPSTSFGRNSPTSVNGK